MTLADYVRPTQVKISDDKNRMLFTFRFTYKSLAELGQDFFLGGSDNNPGIFTLQTERYFQTLRNLGTAVGW